MKEKVVCCMAVTQNVVETEVAGPGQCKGVLPRPPEGIPINAPPSASSQTKLKLKFHKLVEIVTLIIGAFVLLNVIILVIRPFFKKKEQYSQTKHKKFLFRFK